ncbi:MAG: hypothetical protein OMM_04866 [Candidatus Magnetoglobus multicellularis str. Araruama]|uniref:Uncharacterized protein n=1 Tax=Candidatus Magnetoglobus multicellularis str. Araruama TaxID=890399 RepID=A0A1V1NZD7_9BACT|nr:MAG: hypothetical protein OMM_04866 [Candidatus Magnetoglobus multicellularis str. Araruama]
MLNFSHQGRQYDVENLLTPGCSEFLRFLFDHEYVRPAFFSAGVRDRNDDLGKKVVQMLIDTGGKSDWIDRYDVYSREDCLDTTRFRSSDREYYAKLQPENFFGNYKKDLRMIHYGPETYYQMVRNMFEDKSALVPDPEKDDEMLKNIILVEEDPSYVVLGQQKNMLLSPTYHHPRPYLINYQGEDTPFDSKDEIYGFKSANTIFYAAGVLDRAFERYLSEDKTLPNILWEEQGEFWYHRDEKRFPDHFFTRGRDVLRKYNPELNFAVAGSESESDLESD